MKWSVFIFVSCCFAGQSIREATTFAQNTSVSSRLLSLPSRTEFYMHDWNAAPTIGSIVVSCNFIGANVSLNFSGGNVSLNVYNTRETGGSAVLTPQISGLPTVGAYIRYQHDPLGTLGIVKTDYLEVWDTLGNRVYNNSATYTGDNATTPNGCDAGGNVGELRSLAFFRVYPTLVAVNNTMPATADGGSRLLEWKFDNSLVDASGNGWDATMSSGLATYVATPNQNAISSIKANPTFWSNWTSLRAGKPATLDGTGSVSQGDSSPTVTYFWTILTAPSPNILTAATWSSRISATPTLTGLVFGDYNFSLTVTNVADNLTATSTMHVGSVAMDNNGVVVQGDSNVDTIFGPQIAFGKNPWGYQDERSLTATTLRSACYDTTTCGNLSNATWNQIQPGTVDYYWYPWTHNKTTLNGSITSSATSIVVVDATKIDASELPTYILIGGIGGEEVKISAVNTGTNTLTVDYDGRAQHVSNGTGVAWGNGTQVVQTKVTGSGTSFLSTVCPLGVGWNGASLYNTGTVTLTAGSATVTGIGTSWTSVLNGRAIRVTATHGGGTPFTFFSYINTINTGTSITLSRGYPSDADTGTFSYNIMYPDLRNVVLHYAMVDGTDSQMDFNTSECGSNTSIYITNSSDVAVLNDTHISGKSYSYIEGIFSGDGGINYYDEGLAHYSLYRRSGWGPALDAFRKLEGQQGATNRGWLWLPSLSLGNKGDTGAGRHASLLGATVAAVLDGKVENWTGIRNYATQGVAEIADDCNSNNYFDVRDNAYRLSWVAMGALFDPDLTQRATWLTQLSNAYTRDNGCKGSDNSWKTSFFNTNGIFANHAGSVGPLTVTNGLAAVTGVGIDPDFCSHSTTATSVSVTNGSDVVNGVGFTFPALTTGLGRKVTIDDQTVSASCPSPPCYRSFNYIMDSSTQIHLSGMWPGATASGLTALIDSNDYMITMGTAFTDVTQLQKAWSCTWNNSTSITLDRPWDAASSNVVFGYRGNIAGRGQQAFILGVKAYQMALSSKVTDPTISTNYNALANLAANWIVTNGYDPVTKGLYYFNIFAQCLPIYATSSQPDSLFLPYINPGCSYSPSIINNMGTPVARTLSAEAQNAYRVLYENTPTPTNKTFGDQFYGAQWGAPGFASAGATYNVNGIYSDGATVSNIDNTSLKGAKWTGFFLGFGMSHQWPAVRLGGVAPAINRTMFIPFTLITGATALTITVTSPSGKITPVSCGATSPCQIMVDARQGNHHIAFTYTKSSGTVVVGDGNQNLEVVVQ